MVTVLAILVMLVVHLLITLVKDLNLNMRGLQIFLQSVVDKVLLVLVKLVILVDQVVVDLTGVLLVQQVVMVLVIHSLEL